MAAHCSILAWRIPWTEESGEYSPWGHRGRYALATKAPPPYPFIHLVIILTLFIPVLCAVLSSSALSDSFVTSGSSFYGISQAKYWSGLLFPSPGHLPSPGIEPTSLVSPAWQADSLLTEPPGKPATLTLGY